MFGCYCDWCGELQWIVDWNLCGLVQCVIVVVFVYVVVVDYVCDEDCVEDFVFEYVGEVGLVVEIFVLL